jgi:hypothetical protein
MKKEDKLLQKAVKKVTSSKEKAMKFLKSAGIMTYKGNLSQKYR